ncbi:hypothetical protein TNCV_1962491 [Trichonephila clavipes]|nr:hypothetical protein TNCV_1962491 [Trichonephila clavipes]
MIRSKGLQSTSYYTAHVPTETNKRPLEEQPGPSFKRLRFPNTTATCANPFTRSTSHSTICPFTRSTCAIIRSPWGRDFGANPYTDDSSMDQIMSFVFGDYSQQVIQAPPAPETPLEPQVFDTVPSLFDESNDLFSFFDHFQTGLAREQQETPKDLTMLRLKKKVRRATRFKVIKPLDLSVHVCFCLAWVELRFFQVGRPPSHRVSDAYQPQNTDAYTLDFTDCTRDADVYVKWLAWLDDWEMHRDDNFPWRMVGFYPWKRALEKHVQRTDEKALANGMPSEVTLFEHI